MWRYLSVFLFGLAVLLPGLSQPSSYVFDEFHYVPAAKEFLKLGNNPNWEHPPLGKLLIAASIGVVGDHPLGWRLAPVLAGALTLVALFGIARRAFTSAWSPYGVVLITVLNQMWFVQSRVAMLDPFMIFFVTAAIWAQLHSRRWTAAILFGFAIASKWPALISLAGVMAAVYWPQVRSFWGEGQFKWNSSLALKEIFSKAGIETGLTAAAYLLPFSIFFWMDSIQGDGASEQRIEGGRQIAAQIVAMSREMWEGQQRVVSEHPYASPWWQWPTLIRPMWYAFEKEGLTGEWVRGVMMLGNPLVLLPGLLAVLACAWHGFKTRRFFSTPSLVAYGYFLSVACWWLIPRKVHFFYYYYPSAILLGFALIWALDRMSVGTRALYLSACAAMMAYFYPVLAGVKIPAESFVKWAWFSSWI